MEYRTGPWELSLLRSIPKNDKKVFSCFHCGGGSTMGYKLAGFEVLGGVEIDFTMWEIYNENHRPKLSYHEDIKIFNRRTDLPSELFDFDILDGSPPCSSFSMAGSREDSWGKEKKFREGQSKQVLDDLFFDFVETAIKLRPKIVIAENVKGLVTGNARGYVRQIADAFGSAGYDLQLFLLNAAFMGVPQKRERVFFIGRRRDLKLAPLFLEFNEPPISFIEAFEGIDPVGRPCSPDQQKWWERTRPGKSFSAAHPNSSWFNSFKANPTEVANTVCGTFGTSGAGIYHWEKPNHLSAAAYIRLQSFPDDFNFLDQWAGYVCGMSVPPFMMQRIADQIYRQWLTPKTKTRKADRGAQQVRNRNA